MIALTRGVSPAIVHCELTHLAREPIDLDRAQLQHRRYQQALAELGCQVISLPEEPDLPDAVFVEDAAVVLEELAVITRPGAVSRRAEITSVAASLQPYRPLAHLVAPGTLDGGDVLRVGGQLFVGQSSRSNPEGIEQLSRLIGPAGYQVTPVQVEGCLHLKSAVTAVAERTLLINPEWIDARAFQDYELIEVDPSEPAAANALRIGDRLIVPAAFPETARRLEARGFELLRVDLSELAKAEGAVTCCSLVFPAAGSSSAGHA